MTRDETIRERSVARFLECEAKRAEERQKALDHGNTEDEAREIAHEAARSMWNLWAVIPSQEIVEVDFSKCRFVPSGFAGGNDHFYHSIEIDSFCDMRGFLSPAIRHLTIVYSI